MVAAPHLTQAREKQIARLGREEALGALGLQLANGKRVSVAQLRGAARLVFVAGSSAQVAAAVAAAEPFKEELKKKGVLVVPVPIYDAQQQAAGEAASTSAAEVPGLPPLASEDLRWRATALRLGEWSDWFSEQLKFSKANTEQGLYVGLRMDGRVRASGKGQPPWGLFAAQLPPTEGIWAGFGDGFDGRVGPQ